MVENRHKTARNAVKRYKTAKRSGREAKLLVCNRSVSRECGRSQSAGMVTAQTIVWQTCGFVKRFDEPCAFPGKVKGQHRCGRMSCSHISGMLRAVTCSPELPETAPSGRRPLFGPFGGCFVIVRLLILDDAFWLFLVICVFLCSFIFVCGFLAVFGAFPVILWSFYVRQFLFCGCFFNHRSCLCDAGFWLWWCSVVLFVVILCLLLLFCVFVIISLFLVVVYFFWSDITFVKTSVNMTGPPNISDQEQCYDVEYDAVLFSSSATSKWRQNECVISVWTTSAPFGLFDAHTLTWSVNSCLRPLNICLIIIK